MSVRNCVFPWHWALITNDGNVLPCSHGSLPVGNLRDNTLEEIWNAPLIQEVRACLLKGEVHRICRSTECPFQRNHPAFAERKEPLLVDEPFARAFDEDWYLNAYPEVREAIDKDGLVSGLEHFIRHGRQEARSYRLLDRPQVAEGPFSLRKCFEFFRRWFGAAKQTEPLHNAVLGLCEYSKGLTVLQAKPVDVVLAVSTVCNLRCVMCPQGMGLVENPSHMPVEMLERARSFLNTASRMLVAGIGEPMQAPAFWWIVDHVRSRKDLFIRVNSNGHSLNAEKAERIVNSGVTEISFSLDAATAETYAKIRGGDFEKALAGVSALLRARASHQNRRLGININLTLMRENVAEAAAFVRLGHRLGVDSVVFTQLFTFGDRPDWKVDRANWTFVYSEQMLGRMALKAREHLLEAMKCSKEIGLPVHLRDNVASYVQ